MLLKAALNGNRSREEHPGIPLFPGELAAEAKAAVEAGADALHVHPRDREGRESLAAPDTSAALRALRAACPETPVGVSTGAWIEPDVARRLAHLASWQELPDFASVNFHEPGAEDVARCLLDRGVDVEAGLASAEAVRRFVSFARASQAVRVLLEPPEDDPTHAETTVREMERILDESGLEPPRLLHGTGATAWPLLDVARRWGYGARMGLEDTLLLPGGARAHSNGELIREARARMDADLPSFCYLWEYLVRLADIEKFEAIYDGGGEWARLFRRDRAYIRTDLVRDLDRPGRFLTIDRWVSREACQAFRKRFRAELEELDERCEELTLQERHLGDFELL